MISNPKHSKDLILITIENILHTKCKFYAVKMQVPVLDLLIWIPLGRLQLH